MPKKFLFFIIFLFVFLLLSPFFTLPVSSANPETWGDITNSATISDLAPTTYTVSAPILIAPADGSITNNRYEQFSWYKSTPDTDVSHYTLYLDDIIVAGFVSHAPNQDTTSFTASVIDNIISLNLKSPLSEGEHTWKVMAYSNDSISSATSHTFTFTVDATIPIIILQAVDKNTMYWASNDPSTIPPYDQRHLTVTHQDPLLSGKVEAYANLKVSLVCPANLPACADQSFIINDPDGNWEHRFYNLIPQAIYSAYLSATDAAGNSNIFPVFTITYTPTPLISLPFFPKPTLTPTPPIEPTPISPTPSVRPPEEIIPFRQPPPPPLPPPLKPIPEPVTLPPFATPQSLTIITLLGLLTHLSLTAFGINLKLSLLPQFFSTLLIPPFLILKDDLTLGLTQTKGRLLSQPLPFTTLFIYSLEPVKDKLKKIKDLSPAKTLELLRPILKKPLHTLLTGPLGRFNLKLKDPGSYLITARHPGYIYPDQHLKNQANTKADPFLYHSQPIILEKGSSSDSSIPHNHFHLQSSRGTWYFPLDSKPKASQTALERLQNLSLTTRSLPLGLSLITVILSFFISPSLLAILLFFIISDLGYNQYIHPKT